jgi:Domain of unknown function (DUF4411)
MSLTTRRCRFCSRTIIAVDFQPFGKNVDALIANGNIISTREVMREIEGSSITDLRNWAKNNSGVFTIPASAEGAFIAKIYSVTHFQQNIEQQKLLKGGHNADPFVIAKAAIDGGTVVTMELLKPNAAKIPNICKHFSIPCKTLEEFMEAEGWQF